MKIALLAGEPSGDLLGAGLIAALKTRFPAARFEGIGGERMIAQGCASLFPMDRLSVMGLWEVLGHLPDLLRIRRSLYRRFVSDPPDVFVGIDAPDFNLPLEGRLRRQGIRTVHFVSPSVWAWRPWRVRKIARAVDLMLTVLPFEAAFYEHHGVPVRYVGHPLADEIAPLDRQAARAGLGWPMSWRTVVALLPGSRMSEVRRLAPLLLDTARWLRAREPELDFALPAATPRVYAYLAQLIAERASDLGISLSQGQARAVMAAADIVILASGTATLEAMLLQRPLVVTYKVAAPTAWLAKRLLRIRHFALPNLLAGRELVPEFIQWAATTENLGQAALRWLHDPAARARLQAEFADLSQHLRRDASAQAAAAIAELLESGRNGHA